MAGKVSEVRPYYQLHGLLYTCLAPNTCMSEGQQPADQAKPVAARHAAAPRLDALTRNDQ